MTGPDVMPFEIARAGIGLVPEGRQVFSNLTVAENLQTFFGHRMISVNRTGISTEYLLCFQDLPRELVI